MRARDIMTRDPEVCRREHTARDAARVMRDRDCGCVPIVDDSGSVVGIVTDRDLAIRAIASGKDFNTKLNDLMTPVASCCGPDDDLRDVEQKMAELQVRRIPIIDAGGRSLGIISQADIARGAGGVDGTVTEQEIALVVEQISQACFERDRGTPPGLAGDTRRIADAAHDRAAGEAARFEADHPSVGRPWFVQQHERYARCFPCTWRGLKNESRRAAKGLPDLGKYFVDGERRHCACNLARTQSSERSERSASGGATAFVATAHADPSIAAARSSG